MASATSPKAGKFELSQGGWLREKRWSWVRLPRVDACTAHWLYSRTIEMVLSARGRLPSSAPQAKPQEVYFSMGALLRMPSRMHYTAQHSQPITCAR